MSAACALLTPMSGMALSGLTDLGCCTHSAMFCVLASSGLDVRAHQLAGLQLSVSAWSATVAALLTWQGFHVAVLVLMGGFVCARCWAGKLLPNARSSIDNSAILWH